MKRASLVLALLTGSTCLQAATPLPCLIEPDKVIELGSPIVGILDSIKRERGDTVKKGELIAVLKSDVEQRTVQLASARARDQAEVQSAIAAYEHAKRERTRAQLMYEQKLVSRQFLDQATTEASLAEHRLEQARANNKQAQLELGLAKSRLDQSQLRSPIDGVISERYVSAGQRVQEQPIVRIVKVDPLKVQVIVPAELFNEFKIGDALHVHPDVPGAPIRQATVTIVDRIIDPASNTFRMTLELPNKDQAIPAGARCSINYEDNTIAGVPVPMEKPTP